MHQRTSSVFGNLGSWHGPRLRWWFLTSVFLNMLVHLARSRPTQQLAELLGSAPNLIAALGLPALVLVQREHRWARRLRTAGPSAWGIAALAISQGSLLAWELAQKHMKGMYFDFHDIVATGLGALVWSLICIYFPMPADDAA